MSDRTVLGTLMPGFAGPVLPDWLDRMLREGLGGVCLFGENVESPEQLRTLTAAIHAANPTAVVAIDEEGGDVTRLYYDRGAPFPGNAVLGRLDDVEATRSVGAAVGRELAAVGIDLDLAPDADVNSNPLNPVIGVRSFGADPALVARHTVAWVEGLQSQRVAACVKHFPGHGDTAQDSHLALPTVDAPADELDRRELVPFAAAVAADSAAVMTSHIVVPAVDPSAPATFSRPILEGILRERMGFGGVIVSDALDMAGASAEIGIPAAAVRALAAGCDLLCIGTRNTEAQMRQIAATIESAITDGRLTEDRVRSAADRVSGLREGRAAREATAADHDARSAALDVEAIAATFRVAPGVLDALASRGEWAVVRHDPEPNVAVGDVPWGPFGALAELRPDLAPVDSREWSAGRASLPADAAVLLVGRDNARRPELAAILERLRAAHPLVVTVDMGWPGDDGTAQIATFGGSALVGDALAALLLHSLGARAGVTS